MTRPRAKCGWFRNDSAAEWLLVLMRDGKPTVVKSGYGVPDHQLDYDKYQDRGKIPQDEFRTMLEG